MSHFTVLVIGDDPERQLQPFHEFECTGTDDEFVVDVDITAEVAERITEDGLDEALDYHGLKDRQVPDETSADRAGRHKYGYAVVRDGALLKAVDRTNPNKKWDWYSLGGRWKGMLLTRTGRECDQALVRDVDFKAMRDRSEARALARYHHGREKLLGTPEPRTWESVREEHGADLDAARKAFHSQPAYVAARADKELLHDCFESNLHEFWWPESRHVFRARKEAFVTFAVLKDGNWYARGRMGWWAVVHDEEDKDEWLNRFEQLVDSLAPETLISVYDCHT